MSNVVHFNGLDSIIESIYLEDRLGSRIGDCNVFVNPENIKYLVGKLVIINSLSYPTENIQELVDNGNKVVSRIRTDSTLYFPKLDPSCYDVMDAGGNLTALGWALHQVGVKVRDGLNFPHLDLIKLGKAVNI